jgi:CBS domain containing-hemolysin-like protein
MHLAVVLILIIALTAASSLFSGSEIAFFSLTSSRVKAYRHQLDPRKRLIARLLAEPKNLLVTIFLLNTITNVLVQNLTSDLFPLDGGWALKVGIPLALILIFGELLPKYIGLLYNEPISYQTAPIYDFLEKISKPIRYAITEFADFFSRILFCFLRAEEPLSPEELEHALVASEGRGLIHKDEVEFVKGYLSLEEKQVRDLMIPRNEVPYYDITLPLSKLIFLFSTLPEVLVLRGEEEPSAARNEQIIGIIRARDYFAHEPAIREAKDILKIISRPFFIPETSSAKMLLQLLLQQDKNAAVAVDEYGDFSGFIGRNELVEVLSKPKESPEVSDDFVKVSPNAIIAAGKMPLEDVRELFSCDLESEHHSLTIGGYITEILGHIPKSGTTLEKESLTFRIIAAEPTHILKVYIQKKGGGKKSHDK